MKYLIPFTTALFLFIQTIGFSQAENMEITSEKQDIYLKESNVIADVDTRSFKSFIGKYYLAEADLELEIIQENSELYLVSQFSKDMLSQKNETTVHEATRGIDLEYIKNDNNALKYTQNGYETTIKRLYSKTEK